MDAQVAQHFIQKEGAKSEHNKQHAVFQAALGEAVVVGGVNKAHAHLLPATIPIPTSHLFCACIQAALQHVGIVLPRRRVVPAGAKALGVDAFLQGQIGAKKAGMRPVGLHIQHRVFPQRQHPHRLGARQFKINRKRLCRIGANLRRGLQPADTALNRQPGLSHKSLRLAAYFQHRHGCQPAPVGYRHPPLCLRPVGTFIIGQHQLARI